MIFQGFNLIFTLTVGGNVLSGVQLKGKNCPSKSWIRFLNLWKFWIRRTNFRFSFPVVRNSGLLLP